MYHYLGATTMPIKSWLNVPRGFLHGKGARYLSELKKKNRIVTDRAKDALALDSFDNRFRREQSGYAFSWEVDDYIETVELVTFTLGDMGNSPEYYSPEIRDVVHWASREGGFRLCPPSVGPLLALMDEGDSFPFKRAVVLSHPLIMEETCAEHRQNYVFQYKSREESCLSLVSDFVCPGFRFRNYAAVFGGGYPEEQVFVVAKSY